MMPIKFFRSNNKYFCFSNFSQHPVEVDGLKYPTSEHYYQSMKFYGVNPERAEQIRLAATPRIAADMGRDASFEMQPDWEKYKIYYMCRVIQIKTDTYESIQKLLLETGEEEIIEDSPRDYYWGCGKDGSGKNKLGILWMTMRACLRDPYLMIPLPPDSIPPEARAKRKAIAASMDWDKIREFIRTMRKENLRDSLEAFNEE